MATTRKLKFGELENARSLGSSTGEAPAQDDSLVKDFIASIDRVCLYLKRLSDVQLSILEQIVQQSYEYIKSQDGRMHRALE